MAIAASKLMEMVNNAIENTPYDRKPADLYEPIKYVLSLGGKRIRPVLMLMAYNLYKDNVEDIMTQAIAIETYHNFTLLHDDVMDKADMRRGKPTVHKVWNENTAILSGDTMLILAMKRMAETDNKAMAEVLNLFMNTALEIDEGQQMDMDFEERNDVNEEEYIEMIRLKTSVLLACALKIGALLGGADESDANNLYKFGERIGLAFQLQDDMLDVYGDEKVFGKQIGGDITCNKKTFMLINAFNKADEQTYKELTSWIEVQEFDRNEKVKAVTEIYNKLSIKELAQKRIEQYFSEAADYLNKVNVTGDKKSELKAYADKMLHRNK